MHVKQQFQDNTFYVLAWWEMSILDFEHTSGLNAPLPPLFEYSMSAGDAIWFQFLTVEAWVQSQDILYAFVVDKVAPWQVISIEYYDFPLVVIIPPLLHINLSCPWRVQWAWYSACYYNQSSTWPLPLT